MPGDTQIRTVIVGCVVVAGLAWWLWPDGRRADPPPGAQTPAAATPEVAATPAAAVDGPTADTGDQRDAPLPAGVIELVLPGCEGEVSLEVRSTIAQRSAERGDLPTEHRTTLTDGHARLEAIPPLRYSVFVGQRYLGSTELGAEKGRRFRGGCRDDCAIAATILTDGCADEVDVELLEGEQPLDGQTAKVGTQDTPFLWSDLSCNRWHTIRVTAEGCMPVDTSQTLDEPLWQPRIELQAADSYRVQAVGHSDGSILSDGRVIWSSYANSARFDAGPWGAHEHVIQIEAPGSEFLRIEADEHLPRRLVRDWDQGPDEVAQVELEPLEDMLVRCTLDEEPCDPEHLDVRSTWFSYVGPDQDAWCTPVLPKGHYRCPAGRIGLGDSNNPRLSGWLEGEYLGQQYWSYPLEEPVVLELFTERQPQGVHSDICVDIDPPPTTACEGWVALGGGRFSTPRVRSGVPTVVEVEAGSMAFLSCVEGWLEAPTQEQGCIPGVLEPWASVCVVHEPASRCGLLGRDLIPFSSHNIEGCNDRVPAGTYTPTCIAGEVDGRLDWVHCDPVELEAGETAEIRCW
jgi:hypothetical protein